MDIVIPLKIEVKVVELRKNWKISCISAKSFQNSLLEETRRYVEDLLAPVRGVRS